MEKKIIKIYNLFLRWLIKKFFLIGQRMGIHITYNHFYEPVPDTRTLPNELWVKHTDMVGVRFDKDQQINLLFKFQSMFEKEFEKFPKEQTKIPYQYFVYNNSFEFVDGEIYYCMIRYFKPRKIIEIGAGYSSYLAAQAILKNKEEGKECKLIVVDPYPNETIKKGFPGLSELIKLKVEDINISLFQELKENDILFIDSSHILKINNDVHYLYLEVLPKLNKGVFVHIHDIFLPADYPRKWVLNDYKFWNEQYLLQAFLTFNNSFEVVFGASYMHLKHKDILKKIFSSYKPSCNIGPGSFWIKRIKR